MDNERQLNAYCLQCITGYERYVVTDLKKRGIEEAYFPISILNERRQGHWINRERALLPGYVFFFCRENIQSLNITGEKIVHVLRYSDGCTALLGSDLAFAMLVRRYAGCFTLSKALKEGDQVQIVEGPLADRIGRLIYIDKHKRRALIEIEFAGQPRKMALSFEWLSRVDSSVINCNDVLEIN